MPEDNEADINQDPPAEDPDWLKELRRDAKEAKALRAEVATLKRSSAMDEVGVPKTGAGKLFRDAWDGDPSDLDALKAAAREYELIAADGDQPAPEQVTDALNSASSMADLSAGQSQQPTVDALLGEANSIEEIERLANDAGVGVPIR